MDLFDEKQELEKNMFIALEKLKEGKLPDELVKEYKEFIERIIKRYYEISW
jgi:hypothetical protein